MKVLVIPDLHGRLELLQKAIEIKHRYQEIVFMGDIFESFDRSFEDQMKCFELVKAEARRNPNFHWLLGNHEIHYMTKKVEYSGYQKDKQFIIGDALENAKGLYKNAYQQSGVLFTHAGLSQTFLAHITNKAFEISSLFRLMQEGVCKDAASLLNQMSIEKVHLKITDNKYSPLNNISFIRPEGLVKDLVPEIVTQVVGHTYAPTVRYCKVGSQEVIVVDNGQLFELIL